jgi:hypothetical protein
MVEVIGLSVHTNNYAWITLENLLTYPTVNFDHEEFNTTLTKRRFYSTQIAIYRGKNKTYLISGCEKLVVEAIQRLQNPNAQDNPIQVCDLNIEQLAARTYKKQELTQQLLKEHAKIIPANILLQYLTQLQD